MAVKSKSKATTKKVVKKPAKRVSAAANKKTTARRVVAKTTVKKRVTALKEKLTAAQLYDQIAQQVDLPKVKVREVFESINVCLEASLKKNSVGEFTFPGIAKFVVKKKPATKARKGVNPFTGEEMMFKAKPASRVVKIRPLKKLKEMAE